jgi:uncharacterized membrane protein
VACYWKDGVKTDLPTESDYSYTHAIDISKNSIYIAGHYREGTEYTAYYWKNGIRTDIPSANEESIPSAISISGESIYIAGTDFDGNVEIAWYWKDGVKTNLLTGIDSRTDCITIVVK